MSLNSPTDTINAVAGEVAEVVAGIDREMFDRFAAELRVSDRGANDQVTNVQEASEQGTTEQVSGKQHASEQAWD